MISITSECSNIEFSNKHAWLLLYSIKCLKIDKEIIKKSAARLKIIEEVIFARINLTSYFGIFYIATKVREIDQVSLPIDACKLMKRIFPKPLFKNVDARSNFLKDWRESEWREFFDLSCE